MKERKQDQSKRKTKKDENPNSKKLSSLEIYKRIEHSLVEI